MGEGDQPVIVEKTTEPVVSEPTLELKLKILEQRLTIKMIVGFTAAGTIAHLDLPSGLTASAGAALLLGAKFFLARLPF